MLETSAVSHNFAKASWTEIQNLSVTVARLLSPISSHLQLTKYQTCNIFFSNSKEKLFQLCCK